ncbi:MAG: glycoside hydrolase family 18 protein [Gammaproteobacteria bacterium]|nr:glycoside hydrolase family 18 protein [Gammaproteobacteria bacterium]
MSNIWRRFAVLACMAIAVVSCHPDSATDPAEVSVAVNEGNDIEVIAYFHGDTSDIRKYELGDLTQIIYSFLHLDGNRLSIGTARQRTDIRNLVSLKEEYPALKVLVALGGWGGCETCSDVFSTDEGRAAFANSTLELLTEYELDGLDLDWEYPAIEGYPGHAFTAEDKQNLTALIRLLREVLGDGYELSFAAGASGRFMQNSVEWLAVMPLVDRVNLMTYDYVSGDSEVTGHHTPLFPTRMQSASADSTVDFLLDIGIEPEKIVIGAAFYARVWEAVEAVDGNPLNRPGSFKEFVAYRDQSEYFADQCAIQWDAGAQAPYCYGPSSGIFGTFDDKRSVAAKTQYVLDKKLGGIMFWELTQDTYQDGLLSAIAAARTGAEIEL